MTDTSVRNGRIRRSSGAVLIGVAAMALWACAGGATKPESGASAATSATPPTAEAAVSTSVRRFASNLDQAVGLAFDNRGRLLYAEKDTGRIVRVSGGKKTVLTRVQTVAGGGEAGLLGLAVDGSGNVFAYYTGSRSGCPDPTQSSGGNGMQAHCVWRFKPASGRLKADQLIFSSNHPSETENHVGGGLHFGPDGALYLGIGELGENEDPEKGPGRAQSLEVPFGKILRLNPTATNRGATGNPSTCGNPANTSSRNIGDGRIYACGFRNPYSFDWTSSKRLWSLDVGDSCDELNIVKAGVNYGWQPPRTDCAGEGDGRVIKRITGTPSGLAIPKSRAAGSWRNDIFYCLFIEGKLIRYDARTRRATEVPKARGRCGYDLVARGSSIYMSDGTNISVLRIKR